mgnify:CR=1 FL=1
MAEATQQTRNSQMPEARLAGAPAGVVVSVSGDWSAPQAQACERRASEIVAAIPAGGAVTFDMAGIGRLDTLGAWVLSRLQHDLGAAGARIEVVNAQSAHRILFDEIQFKPQETHEPPRSFVVLDILTDIGEVMVDAFNDLVNGIAFLGSFVVASAQVLSGKSRFRLSSLVSQLERVALRSVPIIVLISMLVGGIIAQQSVFQLQSFGTVHFVADLMGVLVLRELAVLITSIMLAGRTGSSFTAELGSMKMREEIDALRTMGLDPIEVLVVPRITALIIGLPLLTFISSMAMLLGGGMVAFFYGGVSPDVFLSRLQNGIGFNTFVVGLLKAPFMALVIGIIACIEGFAVKGSADSLGSRTTSSVVKAIFMVIVVDGLFAMFFASIRY